MPFDFTNPVVTSVVSIVSLFFTVLGVYIMYLQLAIKSLTLEIISEKVTMRKATPDDFWAKMGKLEKYTIDAMSKIGSTMDRLLILRLINSGVGIIEKQDFNGEDLYISFGKESSILECAVLETKSSNKRANVKPTSTKITISPLLLNRGQTVTISVEVRNYEGIEVDPHIKGIRKVRVISNKYPFLRLILIGLSFTISVSLSLPLISSLDMNTLFKVLFMLAIPCLSAATLIKYIYSNIWEKYNFLNLEV